MRITQYLKNPKHCLFCAKQIAYEKRFNKFCNRSCSASYNNQGIRRHGEPPNKTCLSCGTKLVRHQKKYCSASCQNNFRYYQFLKDWKSGIENGVRFHGDSTSAYIKRYLWEKYSGRCAKCGWCETNPYSKRIPLEIEHIDGDATNNKEENLTLLCPNCHALTATYRSLNYGKGRPVRREIMKRRSP